MLSTLSSALSGNSGQTAVGVTPQMIRDIIQEVAQTRSQNLAFRDAVSSHEADQISKFTPSSSTPKLSSRGSSGRSGSGSRMQKVNSADLKLRPPSNRAPSRVPRNIESSIFYDIVKTRGGFTGSGSAAVFYNRSINLQSHPQFSSLIALFDQWCVPQFSMTYSSLEAPGSGSAPPVLHTAIDFDNLNDITIDQIDQFDNANVDVLSVGKVKTRTVRPAVEAGLYGPGNSVTRPWVDCATPIVQWRGIRAGIEAGSTDAIQFEATIWFAFRGRI